MSHSRRYELSFFTATILEWKPLLADDRFKDIIIDSLRHLVNNKRVLVSAFVIMNNHIHLLWHIVHPNKREEVQRDFLKFTAHVMLREVKANMPDILADYYVGAKDRAYQVWERNPLTIGVWTEEIVIQKLIYIHNNPVRAGLCVREEDYKYSSAGLYSGLLSDWDFVEPFLFRS